MATKQKRTDSYRVGKGTKNVTVSVDVGLGQLGGVKLSVDKKPIVSAPAPLGLLDLGPGSALKGKLLIFETLVTDVSIMTNKMSVVIKLTGGTSPKTITTNGEVVEQLESILFQTLVLIKE
jgi:hypothetical protein